MSTRRMSRQRSTFYKLLLVFLFVSILLLKSHYETPTHFDESNLSQKEKVVTIASNKERDDRKSITTVAKSFLNTTTYVDSQTTSTVQSIRTIKKDPTNQEEYLSLKENGDGVTELPELGGNKREQKHFGENMAGEKTEQNESREIIKYSTTTETLLRNATTSTNYDDLEKGFDNAKNGGHYNNNNDTNTKSDNDVVENRDDDAIGENIYQHDDVGNSAKGNDSNIKAIIENAKTEDNKDKKITENQNHDGDDDKIYYARKNKEIMESKHDYTKRETINRINLETEYYTNNDNSSVTNENAEKDITEMQNRFKNSGNNDLQVDFENAPTVDGGAKNKNHNTKNKKDSADEATEDVSNSINRKEKMKNVKHTEGKSLEEKGNRNSRRTNNKADTNRKGKKDEQLGEDKSQKHLKDVKKQDSSDKAVKNVPNVKKHNTNRDKHRKSKESITYGKDKGSKYIKSKYIIHKLLKDDGPNLSAKERAKLVFERCNTFMHENNVKLNSKTKLRYDNKSFMLSQRYELMICFNSKVASNNLKRVSYALDKQFKDDINDVKRHEARGYCQSRMRDIKQVTSGKTRTNFMMVREPLERLVSAYRDERAFPEGNKDLKVTFKEFLQQQLHGHAKQKNRHIYPYFERCRPCEVKYDYIGLQHNFDTDVKTVLQKIKADGKVGIPAREKTGYHSATSDKLVKEYFSKIPNYMIHQLWEKYYKDYYIFGFPYPKHLMK